MKIKQEKCVVCNNTGYIYPQGSTVPKPCENCGGKGAIDIVVLESTKFNNN